MIEHESYIHEEVHPLEDDLIIRDSALRYEVRRLLKEGVYDQIDLFNILYPVYAGHYSKLRAIIAEEKNYA